MQLNFLVKHAKEAVKLSFIDSLEFNVFLTRHYNVNITSPWGVKTYVSYSSFLQSNNEEKNSALFPCY